MKKNVIASKVEKENFRKTLQEKRITYFAIFWIPGVGIPLLAACVIRDYVRHRRK